MPKIIFMKLEIFLAGSKKLDKQRDIIRNQVMQWNANRSVNSHDDDTCVVYTFENFCDSITGDGLTSQERYNKFIRERADIAFFVLYDEINEKTKEEFDTAYESCMNSKRRAPDLIVFSHKSSSNKEIEEIRKQLTEVEKYFKEYDSDENLKEQIGPVLDKYFSRIL